MHGGLLALCNWDDCCRSSLTRRCFPFLFSSFSVQWWASGAWEVTAQLKGYLSFYCLIFASLGLNVTCTCKSPSGLQDVAFSPNIQVRTRSMPGMAGVSQVSLFCLGSSSMLNNIENLGLQSSLVGGTGQLFLMLITRASKINIFSLALVTFFF